MPEEANSSFLETSLDRASLKDLLDFKYEQYNRSSFVVDDPVLVPHRFTRKEDIEISAFLTAIISWGNRTTIINNAGKLMAMMDDSPYEFLIHSDIDDFSRFSTFIHRTFQGADCISFLQSLKQIYFYDGGLEEIFIKGYKQTGDIKDAIIYFRKRFFSSHFATRSRKHLSDPSANSAAKRINLFLRWMIRKDENGVDFGIWNYIPASALYCPLDVHTAATARSLGLMTRTQNDWKAVYELTLNLREFDANDPVKYDFALFGLGRYERWHQSSK